tara:strand:+ start:672 stop:1316 length:645 start_codon:yes stop_codon:yes gene_type:complete
MPIRKAPTPEIARNMFLQFPNKKLQEWADEWGCTAERVRQIKLESGVKSKYKLDMKLANKVANDISSGKHTLTSPELYEDLPIGRDAFMTWMRKNKEVEILILNAQETAKSKKLNPSTKTCKRCGNTKTVDKYSKNQKYADGYMPYCVECLTQKTGASENSKKTCLLCKKDKSRSSFTRNKKYKDGLVPFCKICKSKSRRLKRSINAKVSDTIN